LRRYLLQQRKARKQPCPACAGAHAAGAGQHVGGTTQGQPTDSAEAPQQAGPADGSTTSGAVSAADSAAGGAGVASGVSTTRSEGDGGCGGISWAEVETGAKFSREKASTLIGE
jgi:hypothetical protein